MRGTSEVLLARLVMVKSRDGNEESAAKSVVRAGGSLWSRSHSMAGTRPFWAEGRTCSSPHPVGTIWWPVASVISPGQTVFAMAALTHTPRQVK